MEMGKKQSNSQKGCSDKAGAWTLASWGMGSGIREREGLQVRIKQEKEK